LDPSLLVRPDPSVLPENKAGLECQVDPVYSTDGDDVIIYVDRNKMSQVIHNLVSNGLKFTPAGGRVSVKVTLEDGHQSSIRNVYAPTVGDRTTDPPMVVKISVTDTGVGLSQVNNLEVRCLQHLGSVWVHEQFHDDFLNYSRVTLYLWRYLTLT